jgi:hypothetical protein
VQSPSRNKPIAILTVHGMGAHQRYAGLSDAVDVAKASLIPQCTNKDIIFNRSYADGEPLVGKFITANEDHLSYVQLSPTDTCLPDLHVFEAYYSDVAKEKTSVPEIIRFLFNAGWNSLGDKEIYRSVLEEEIEFVPKKGGHYALVAILLSLLSALILNSAFATLIPKLLAGRAADISNSISKPLVLSLTFIILFAATFGVISTFDQYLRKKAQRTIENAKQIDMQTLKAHLKPSFALRFSSRVQRVLLWAFPIVMIICAASVLIAIGNFSISINESVQNKLDILVSLTLTLFRVSTFAAALYVLYRLAAFTSAKHKLVIPVVALGTLTFGVVSWYSLYILNFLPSATRASKLVESVGGKKAGAEVDNALVELATSITWAECHPFDILASGLIFALLTGMFAYFAKAFLGDVVAYIHGGGPSHHSKIRTEMRQRVQEPLQALLQGGYDVIVVVLENQKPSNGTQQQLGRIIGYLTYGTPLNKVAYVFKTSDPTTDRLRDSVVLSKQPLLQLQFRQAITWINLRSKSDFFSGPASLYDTSDSSSLQTNDPADWVTGGKRKNYNVTEIVDQLNGTEVVSHSNYHNFTCLPLALGIIIKRLDDERRKAPPKSFLVRHIPCQSYNKQVPPTGYSHLV